jgi:hypothetical protein
VRRALLAVLEEQRLSLEHYQKELADIRDEEASLPPRLAELEAAISREKQEVDKEIIGEPPISISYLVYVLSFFSFFLIPLRFHVFLTVLIPIFPALSALWINRRRPSFEPDGLMPTSTPHFGPALQQLLL